MSVGIDPFRLPVLLVGNFLHETTGTYGVCEELAGQLRHRGWTVFTTSNKPSPIPRLADMLSTVWRRRADYNVAQVDVFSGRAFVWAETVCWALHRLGRPFVLTLHGGSLPTFARRRPVRVRALLSSAAAVTTPSEYLLEEMAPYYPGLRLHPNPLPIEKYQFRVREAPRPRLIWLRAFHETYNPVMALEALARILGQHPDAHLTMVGPDRRDGSLLRAQDAAKALRLGEHVTFTGPVAKAAIPGLLAEADVFLNTSNIDNTPISVLEAQASGLCVVSTAVGGIAYLLKDERNALLVPAGNHVAMADAVSRILTVPGLGKTLSIAGRANAVERDCSLVLPRWEHLFRDVAARPRTQ